MAALLCVSTAAIANASSIKSSYKKVTLLYNKHGASFDKKTRRSSDMSLDTIVKGYNDSKNKYTVKFSKKGVVKYKNGLFTSAKKGKTNAAIYETNKKSGKKVKVGKVKFTVKKAKMATVAAYNALIVQHTDFNLNLTDNNKTSDFVTTIKKLIVNNSWSNASFKSSEYSVTYSSSNKKIATVSSKGVITAKKKGTATIAAKIKFSDKSTYTYKATVNVKKQTLQQALKSRLKYFGADKYTVAKIDGSEYYYLILSYGDVEATRYYEFFRIEKTRITAVGTIDASHTYLYINSKTTKLGIYWASMGNYSYGPVSLDSKGNVQVKWEKTGYVESGQSYPKAPGDEEILYETDNYNLIGNF